jgi:hypothetical protein
MQSLTRDEFLEVLALTSGAFDQLQHAGHVALAFGTPMPATPGRYLDLDLVAMAINLGLTSSLGREISTTIVAAFFHQWASAVGHAEADPNENFFMAVGGVGWDAVKKGPKLLLVTHGTIAQTAEDFQNIEGLIGFFTVNISDIMRRLRARALAAGIDLSRPFFFPPQDPRFDQILRQVKRERDARIARLRRDKKKFAAMKARDRRQDITAVPRVQDVGYPLVMQVNKHLSKEFRS